MAVTEHIDNLAQVQAAFELAPEKLYAALSRQFPASDAAPPNREQDGRSRFQAIRSNLRAKICASTQIREFCQQVEKSGPTVLTAVVVDQALGDLDRLFPGHGLAYLGKVYLLVLIAKNGIVGFCQDAPPA
jgi:hypothetical protein